MTDPPPTSPARRDRATGWLLVAAQVALLVLVMTLPRRPAWDAPWLEPVAWGCVGGGLLLGAWAAALLGRGLTPLPLPNGSTGLVTRGPYRSIRHPIYSAVVLVCLGIALRSQTPLVLGTAVLLAGFFVVKAGWEERHLRSAFPGYTDYERRSGRFLPGVGRRR